jgi:ankyrin repeat protein
VRFNTSESNENARFLQLLRDTTVQLEKTLQRYIAEVKGGQRASSIKTSVSTSSLSSTDQRAWAQLRRELQDIGISPQQFGQNRDMIIKTLQEAFSQETDEMSVIPTKKASQLGRLMSSITGNNRKLVSACHEGRLGDVKTILQRGAYLDARDGNGSTALILAAENGHIEIVNILLVYQADVNKADKLGFTPLHIAIRNGNMEVVQILLEYQANVNEISPTGLTPLVTAVRQEHLGLVKLLLEHEADTEQHSTLIADASADSSLPIGTTLPLFSAILSGNIDIVRILLVFGSNTEERLELRKDSCPAIHLAIQRNRIDIVRILLKHNANVNSVGHSGHTPLHTAVSGRQEDIVKLLLDSNPMIDSRRDEDEETALHLAVRNEDEDMAQLLLTSGANILLGEKGSPLHLAAQSGNEGIARLLLRHGAQVNELSPGREVTLRKFDNLHTATEGGETALWLAAAGGHKKVVQLLLDRGADAEKRVYPKACEKHEPEDCLFADGKVLKCSAVQISVAHSHREVAELLIAHGGNLETWMDRVTEHWTYPRNDNGRWPRKMLHLAANSPAAPLKILQLLLDLGAEVNEKDREGQTALHVAAEAGWLAAREKSRVIKMLLANGAAVNARDNYNSTPLHCATETKYSQLEIVEILLKHGADPNATNIISQSTPLHYAAGHGDSKILKCLVLSGGDINVQNLRGWTPKDLLGKYRVDNVE